MGRPSDPVSIWRLVRPLLAALALAGPASAEPVGETPAPAADAGPAEDDAARKSLLLASERWRRAMFEFDAWLAVQPVYGPAEIHRIRSELARRVTTMSSFELEYLLEAIDAKLDVLESPAARDAREWLGRYLSVMSDARRAEAVRAVPDILDMTAAELAAAVQRVEARRAEVERGRGDSLAARRTFAGFLDRARLERTADRARQAAIRGRTPPFSPYRGPGVEQPPFAPAYDTPTAVGVVPWGGFLSVPVAAF